MTVREIALSLLDEYENSGKYVNLSLSSHLADNLGAEDRGFLTLLLYNSVERKITYDYYACALSGRGIDKIDPHTLNILRLGFTQICHMDNLPMYAAVNETVSLARNVGERGFVNGVLRAAIKAIEGEGLPLPNREKNVARYLSVCYSFPLSLTKEFIAMYGEKETEELFLAFNTHGYTDITVNLCLTDRETLLNRLISAGFPATPSLYSSVGIRIPSSVNPRKLPGFFEGHFFVQDEACAVCVEALGVEPGDRVIDVCACPGGKSFAAAIFGAGKCSVRAFDLHASKLSLVESGADRLKLDCITAEVRDATSPHVTLFGTADKVICDCPCSGLGVLGKKPDLRYRGGEEDWELSELQYSILDSSAKYLTADGTLVYSTCTLRCAENAGVVKRFLDTHPDFVPCDFTVGSLNSCGGILTLLPHVHKTDGFFIAKLKKVK